MINLLPPGSQRKVKREYLLRLSEVWLIALTVVGASSILLIFPAYISEGAKHTSLERQKAVADASPARNARDSLYASLKNIQSLVGRAEELNKTIPPTTALKPVLESRSAGITFSSIGFRKSSDTEATVSLEGIAATRNDLVAFVNKLRSIPDFSSVNLPVSNLADSTRIPFTINLVTKITE